MFKFVQQKLAQSLKIKIKQKNSKQKPTIESLPTLFGLGFDQIRCTCTWSMYSIITVGYKWIIASQTFIH